MLWLLFLVAAEPSPDLAALAAREVRRQECRAQDGGGEIVVCGRDDKRARYRTIDPNAPFDVHGNAMSVMRERSRWIEGGEAGPQSCGPVGPGGWTGCLIQQWKKNDLQNPSRK